MIPWRIMKPGVSRSVPRVEPRWMVPQSWRPTLICRALLSTLRGWRYKVTSHLLAKSSARFGRSSTHDDVGLSRGGREYAAAPLGEAWFRTGLVLWLGPSRRTMSYPSGCGTAGDAPPRRYRRVFPSPALGLLKRDHSLYMVDIGFLFIVLLEEASGLASGKSYTVPSFPHL